MGWFLQLLHWVVAVAPEYGKDWGKTRRPSSSVPDSSDDDPLPDKELELNPRVVNETTPPWPTWWLWMMTSH